MLRTDWEDLDTNGNKGDWCFMGGKEESDLDHYLILRYGDDVGQTVVLPIYPDAPMHWDWNGNREAPTLSPSILVHSDRWQPGWHGYLRNGKIETA